MPTRDYTTAIRLSQAQAIIGCSKRTLYRLRDEGLLVTWPVSPDGRERRTSAGHALDAREAQPAAATNGGARGADDGPRAAPLAENPGGAFPLPLPLITLTLRTEPR